MVIIGITETIRDCQCLRRRLLLFDFMNKCTSFNDFVEFLLKSKLSLIVYLIDLSFSIGC